MEFDELSEEDGVVCLVDGQPISNDFFQALGVDAWLRIRQTVQAPPSSPDDPIGPYRKKWGEILGYCRVEQVNERGQMMVSPVLREFPKDFCKCGHRVKAHDPLPQNTPNRSAIMEHYGFEDGKCRGHLRERCECREVRYRLPAIFEVSTVIDNRTTLRRVI